MLGKVFFKFIFNFNSLLEQHKDLQFIPEW